MARPLLAQWFARAPGARVLITRLLRLALQLGLFPLLAKLFRVKQVDQVNIQLQENGRALYFKQTCGDSKDPLQKTLPHVQTSVSTSFHTVRQLCHTFVEKPRQD